MLKWLLKNRINAFERKLGYDMSYAREIVDADPRAMLAFFKATKLGAYCRDLPREARWAAGLAAIVSEDCGPCTQLTVTMALAEGVPSRMLAAVLGNDVAAMGADAALAVRFVRAVVAHSPEADAARQEVLAQWGPRALVSLAFAITTARMYPTVKYAMGYGKECQRVTVAGTPIAVASELRELRGAHAA